MRPTIVSVNIGLPATHQLEEGRGSARRWWRSAIFKSAVDGALRLSRRGLDGDGQAHPRPHHGIDMAVLGYSAEHYPLWRDELGRPDLEFGSFGENLTISGQTEASVCIGDIYDIGEVRLQVTLPRRPCVNLDRRLRTDGMIDRVHATARGGWYFRVLREGRLWTGEMLALRQRPHPDWTVKRAYAAYHHRRDDPGPARLLARVAALGLDWKEKLAG